MLVCDEPTFEGMCRLMQDGQPSMGVFADKGATFVGGHAMKEEAKLRSAGGLSKLWDGDPVKRVRATDGATTLVGRRVSLHLMMQPGVAAVLLSDAVLLDQGLLSRILPTAPSSTSGTRFFRLAPEALHPAMAAFRARMQELLERQPRLIEGSRNELEPRILTLDEGACDVWIKYVNHIELELAPGKSCEPIRGLANKAAEHAARIAAVLALIEDPDVRAVSADAMERGIAIVQHYLDEALRLYGAAKVSTELRLAERLRVWILDRWKGPLISLPDVYGKGPSQIRESSLARRLIKILEDHAWLVRLDQPAKVNGVMRREVWSVVRPEVDRG